MYFRSGWLTPVTKATCIGAQGGSARGSRQKKKKQINPSNPRMGKRTRTEANRPGPGGQTSWLTAKLLGAQGTGVDTNHELRGPHAEPGSSETNSY